MDLTPEIKSEFFACVIHDASSSQMKGYRSQQMAVSNFLIYCTVHFLCWLLLFLFVCFLESRTFLRAWWIWAPQFITANHIGGGQAWRSQCSCLLLKKCPKKPYNRSTRDFSSVLLSNDDIVAIVSSTSCMIYVCSTMDAGWECKTGYMVKFHF